MTDSLYSEMLFDDITEYIYEEILHTDYRDISEDVVVSNSVDFISTSLEVD